MGINFVNDKNRKSEGLDAFMSILGRYRKNTGGGQYYASNTEQVRCAASCTNSS